MPPITTGSTALKGKTKIRKKKKRRAKKKKTNKEEYRRWENGKDAYVFTYLKRQRASSVGEYIETNA